MRIETATVEAAGELARLHARSFERPWSAADFAGLLAEEGGLGLRTADGFILLRALGPEAEILTVAVDPAARGRGIGGALLKGGLAAAGERGVETVFLEAAADNSAALALYERAGFQPVGRRRGYYPRADGAAVDALTLRLSLSRARA